MPNYEKSQGDYYSFDVGDDIHITMINIEYFIGQSIRRMKEQYMTAEEIKDPILTKMSHSQIKYSRQDIINAKQDQINAKQQQIKDFLESDLKANSNKLWKIVVYHSPLYSAGGDLNYNYKDYEYSRGIFETTLFENSVTLLLESHEHDYQRSFPLFNNKIGTSGN
jgi:hypothetical protein